MVSTYKAVWTPVIGEKLSTEQKHGNPEDAFAVAITNVGHITQEISKTCWYFIAHGGEIYEEEGNDQFYLKEG